MLLPADYDLLQLVYVVLNIAGSDQRQDDLFSNESFLAMGRSALKGLKVRCSPSLRYISNEEDALGSRECLYPAYSAYIGNS